VASRADVVIVGLGAMGSQVARSLARRGRRVVGLDRFSPPHALGSSHGRSRIIREAYFEEPAYVPLVQRSYDLWTELERESGRTLLRLTGGLMAGPADGALVRGARRSAAVHDLRCEDLSAPEIRKRFPAFAPDPGMVGVFEPRAGVLFPEACIEAALQGARAAGADLRVDEETQEWEAESGGVHVRTARGSWSAGTLVIAAGAWLPRLVPGLLLSGPRLAGGLPLTVERQVLHWFEPLSDHGLLGPEACPIALWEVEGGRMFYTFPDLGDGVKAAIHHAGEITDTERVRREVTPEDEEAVRSLLGRLVPSAAGARRESAVCLYTNTPDRNFLIDRHPEHERVLLVSPCSGHGFKFAPVIGEIVADLVTEGASRFDLRPFALDRLC
jgi:sarcosine oxidase